MINPRRKRIIGILIILIFSGILGFAIVSSDFYSEGFLNPYIEGDDFNPVVSDSEYKYMGICKTAESLAESFEKAYEGYYKQIQIEADLAAKALYAEVSEKGDNSIGMVGDGGIIKFENGEVTTPGQMSGTISKNVNRITGVKGHINANVATQHGIRKDLIVYSKIKGPYYYVEEVDGGELEGYILQNVGYYNILMNVETAFNMNFFLICNDRSTNYYFRNLMDNLAYRGGGEVFEALHNGNFAEVYAEGDDIQVPSTEAELAAMPPEDLQKLDGRMVISSSEGISVRFMVRDLEALDCKIVMAFITDNSITRILEKVSMELFLVIVFSLAFLIWITSAYKEMLSGTVSAQKKDRYLPGRVRIITVSYGILSVLTIFAFSFYVQALGSIYQEKQDLGYMMDALENAVEYAENNTETLQAAQDELYVEYANRVADLLERFPELNAKVELGELNKILGTEFIMTFDADGKEVSTSSNYINMTLGDEDGKGTSSLSDFRRLLKGVPSIIHGAEVEETTGRELELIGVRTNDTVNGGYGALILALKPDESITRSRSTYVERAMNSLVPEGKLVFSVDPDGYVAVGSRSDVVGLSLEDLTGRDPVRLMRDGVADFIDIDGVRYYCISKKLENDSDIYFAGTPSSMLLANGTRLSLVAAIGYGILFLLLSAYLLFGYTYKVIGKIENGEAGGNKKPEEGKRSTIAGAEKRFLKKIGGTTPEKKARLVFRVAVALFIINMLLGNSGGGDEVGSSYVISYILSRNWEKGLNLFAITAIIMLFCSIMLLTMFARFVFKTIGRMLNSKGNTVCRMLSNMFTYVGLIVFVYLALTYLGVDTNAILASVGVLGIGLSMGAQDVIANILAGVTTILEGSYQVGDIVDIDGYRGEVQEIGVRSTKVIGRGGNVRIFGNRDIKNVTNLTKNNSWVAIKVRVDVTYSLKDVEEILSETLPRVGEECKEIISGPYYKGVLSVEAGFAVLSIIAECREDNYHKVERTLYREVLMALRSENVPVR